LQSRPLDLGVVQVERRKSELSGVRELLLNRAEDTTSRDSICSGVVCRTEFNAVLVARRLQSALSLSELVDLSIHHHRVHNRARVVEWFESVSNRVMVE
jgi:hypothetical protein